METTESPHGETLPNATVRADSPRGLMGNRGARRRICSPEQIITNPMSITKNTLGKTHVSRSYPWGLHPRNGHRLLCSDGVIRAAEMAETADTYFSVPASVRINGKRISGYATCERDSKWKHEVWAFRHHTNQDAPLPKWPSSHEPEHDALISKAVV